MHSPHRSARRACLAVVALLLLAVTTWAQTLGTVTRNVYLRVEPASDQEEIRKLLPPEQVTVLDQAKKQNGFYHVVTAQGEEGWAWAGNIKVEPGQAPATPAAPIVFHGCPLEGTAIPQNVKDLNVLKNRYTPPADTAINQGISLQAILAQGSDTDRWKTTDAAEIDGRVHDVKIGGVETCNCRAKEKELRDTHIEFVLSATDSGPRRRVIVEVTPRWRHMKEDESVDWSTDTLKAQFLGKEGQGPGLDALRHPAQRRGGEHGARSLRELEGDGVGGAPGDESRYRAVRRQHATRRVDGG